MSKDFDAREGEIAVDLPAKTDAGLYFIGRIRTPWKQRKECPKNARESDAVCTVELDARWAEGCKTWRRAAISPCCTGWTSRRETLFGKFLATTEFRAALLLCARRRAPTRSP